MAVILLAASVPLLLLVALAIRLTDGGSILFWQSRVGLGGRSFDFPKFRSMVPDAERMTGAVAHRNHHGNSITYKSKDDPRVTWIGRVIRRFSVDELPQLWCVVRGEMSLVGPRPALPNEVAQYQLADRRRLDVKPGLTCIWQVSGRADIPFDKQVVLDVEYVERHSLTMDFQLILQTIPAVISTRGAY